MEWYFLISLALIPYVYGPDPAPILRRSRTDSRNMDCQRVGVETGHRLYPGKITASKPRGDYAERSVVVCEERLTRPGLRSARDEAILTSLEERVHGLVTAVHALHPEADERTWLVETHYPSGPVAAKIGFATKNALVGHGLTVSDRTPMLGVGDIDVITRMQPEQAYPTACRRYADTGSLGAGDALLAILVLDPRETALHAGICVEGRWEWLQ